MIRKCPHGSSFRRRSDTRSDPDDDPHTARAGARLGEILCHTFRTTGITTYLLDGGTLERAQALTAHESLRRTKLYDRTAHDVTLEDIEKIAI